jgi:hypothetical protein
MSVKTLSVRQFAAIKRVAQNVNPLVVKKHKLINKINELNEEITNLTQEIEGHEAGVKAITGGYISEQLVTKVVKDKLDKNGNTIKEVKYEPTSIVSYNQDTNTYEISVLSHNNTTEESCEKDEQEDTELI